MLKRVFERAERLLGATEGLERGGLHDRAFELEAEKRDAVRLAKLDGRRTPSDRGSSRRKPP
jgi:hypothetical protein